jgi:glycerol-3-phosphate dehydrogenase
MSSNAEFIAYCLEEYKAAQGMTGKEVITLFKKYNVIDYIVSCYGAHGRSCYCGRYTFAY